MANKRKPPRSDTPARRAASTAPKARGSKPGAANTSARSTTSGPSRRPAATIGNAAAAKMAATEELAEAFPFNAAKPTEFGKASAAPRKGQSVEPSDPNVG